jgi:hypothetical protein
MRIGTANARRRSTKVATGVSGLLTARPRELLTMQRGSNVSRRTNKSPICMSTDLRIQPVRPAAAFTVRRCMHARLINRFLK